MAGTITEVTTLIQKIFVDIKERTELSNFQVVRQMHAGQAGAVTDALVLQPNFAGLGVDLKKLGNFFKSGFRRMAKRSE